MDNWAAVGGSQSWPPKWHTVYQVPSVRRDLVAAADTSATMVVSLESTNTKVVSSNLEGGSMEVVCSLDSVVRFQHAPN